MLSSGKPISTKNNEVINMNKEQFLAYSQIIHDYASGIIGNLRVFYPGDKKLAKEITKKTAEIQKLSLDIKTLLEEQDALNKIKAIKQGLNR